VRQLEKDLADLRVSHAKEIEEVRKRFNDALETAKTSHAEELQRAINEANRGWAEADRLRNYLIPGLPAVTRVTESPDNTPNKEIVEEGGTPFQRISRKILAEDEKRYQAEEAARKARELEKAKPAEPVTVPAGEKK